MMFRGESNTIVSIIFDIFVNSNIQSGSLCTQFIYTHLTNGLLRFF